MTVSVIARLRGLLGTLGQRFARGPIRSREQLVEFLDSRSAYVAQTSLFGYLKTRMGTSYAKIFQDPAFAEPLATAQTQVYLDCLADLTVFAVAHGGQGGRAEQLQNAAMQLFSAAAQSSITSADDVIAQAETAFRARLTAVDWSAASVDEAAFTQSPQGLVDAAPVIDGYKHMDREIVMNSIRFRWHDVRRQLRDRMDVAAIGQSLSVME